jgi:hypothetical protein
MDKLETQLHLAFIEWFKTSGVDFWDESNAPEELAELAVKIINKELMPKLREIVDSIR